MGRVGGGAGTGEGTGKSMRKLCRDYPLANYPLVSRRPKMEKFQDHRRSWSTTWMDQETEGLMDYYAGPISWPLLRSSGARHDNESRKGNRCN